MSTWNGGLEYEKKKEKLNVRYFNLVSLVITPLNIVRCYKIIVPRNHLRNGDRSHVTWEATFFSFLLFVWKTECLDYTLYYIYIKLTDYNNQDFITFYRNVNISTGFDGFKIQESLIPWLQLLIVRNLGSNKN